MMFALARVLVNALVLALLFTVRLTCPEMVGYMSRDGGVR